MIDEIKCLYMKHAFSIPKFNGFSISLLKKVLPTHFEVSDSDKDKGRLLIILNFQENISNQEVINELQRELDRLSFFIGHPIPFRKEWEENANGFKNNYFVMDARIDLLGGIPDNLGRQAWAPELSIQLCLWRLTLLADIPYPAEINLLFQIIEMSNPSYPKYEDPSVDPNPLTEARLLRNLVSHRQPVIQRDELNKYCDFLGIPREFHDPTDKDVINAIKKRKKIVKEEAKKIILNSLS